MPAKKLLLFSALSIAVLFSSCSSGGGGNDFVPETVSDEDSRFITNRFSDHNMVTMNSEIAGKSYATYMVRSYANLVNAEFSFGQVELKKLGSQKRMSLPVEDYLDAGDAQSNQSIKDIAKANPQTKAFDIAYIDMEIAVQQRAIELLEYEMSKGSDKDVTAYATKYLGKAQMFKKMADSIRIELNK